MKQYTNVRGSQETVLLLEVNVDTVYVRSNITRIATDDFVGWQYDEIQYGVREYIEYIGQENSDLKINQASQDELIMNIMLGEM